MRQVILLFFLLGLNLHSAGIEYYRAGARPLALSDAYVSVSDIWSSFYNQAGIAGIDRLDAGIFYESPFLLKELSNMAGSILLPTKTGNFALSFTQFGKKSYKEKKLGLAFGKQLGKKLKAGIQFDYFSMTLPENDRAFGFTTFEGGVIFTPIREFTLGAHAFNPVNAGIRYEEGMEKIPVRFCLGGNYILNDILLFCLEGEKEGNYPVCLKTGFEYQPVREFAVRFGFSGKPYRLTAGMGYKTGRLSADLGFSYHNSLGVTPSVSLQYQLK